MESGIFRAFRTDHYLPVKKKKPLTVSQGGA